MPGVHGFLRLASGKWSPVFPKCGPVLFYPVRSCILRSCPVLSCPMPLSSGMSCLVFFEGCHFRILTVSAFAVSLFPCCPFVCLSVSSSFHLYSCFRSTRGRGPTFTSARVLVSSTCRQSRLAHRHKGLHFTCIPCSRAHFTLVPAACVPSPRDWAVSRGSHKQNNDMANYRIGSCTKEPSGRPLETAGHSAPASLSVPFQIVPFLHPALCGVPTVPWLCAVSLLLPRMLVVLLIFQMITVHTFASDSNAKLFDISATTLCVVWTSAACALMF